MGTTGVGKSTLCNLLCGNAERFEVNDDPDSVTQETHQTAFNYEINNQELQFEIIDCPGFFDTKGVFQKMNRIEAFKSDIKKKVNEILNNGDELSIKEITSRVSTSTSEPIFFIVRQMCFSNDDYVIRGDWSNPNTLFIKKSFKA